MDLRSQRPCKTLLTTRCAWGSVYGWLFTVELIICNDSETKICVPCIGAGGGIGRKLSLEFAAHGAKLVLWDINKGTFDKLCDDCLNLKYIEIRTKPKI